MEFWNYGILSLIVVVLTVVVVAFRRKPMKRKKEITNLQLGTVGVFLAIFIFLIPGSYCWGEWKDTHLYIRPLLLTFFNTVRVFLMDTDLKFVTDALVGESEWKQALFSLYGMLLYVAAPILTFTNILSVFKNWWGEWHVKTCRRRKICVMSELNPQSLTLAESIYENDPEKPMLVFCDVFAQNEEENYELLLQAQKLSAICLKKDVAHIDFKKRGKPIEIYLIGENDAENTSQAIGLTENITGEKERKNGKKNAAKQKNKTLKRKCTVYVYSADSTTDYILDSLDMGKEVLSKEFTQWLEKNAKNVLQQGDWTGAPENVFGNFTIHHIDPVFGLVRDVLTIDDYADYKKIREDAERNRKLSITILGMGKHGTQFLKTAVWFYQKMGTPVEFNVFDLGDTNGDPAKRLGQECPELVEHPFPGEDGDALYDIKFFTGVDCFSVDFDRVVLNTGRLAKTNLVFVALGDDDRNIRAAQMIKKLFAFKNAQQKGTMPLIYAVVYDDKKADNLRESQAQKTQKDITYVGACSSQYSYEAIKKQLERTQKAIHNHMDWTSKECQLRHAYTQMKNTALEDMNHEQLELNRALEAESVTEVKWSDLGYYKEDQTVNVAEVKSEIERFVRKSYFRKASLAQALYQEATEQKKAEKHSLCMCDACKKKRIAEHMRWNAYMRSLGFRYNEKKDFDAKTHGCLLPWEKLPWKERYKD